MVASKRRTHPRTPKQERSRSTVEALVEAVNLVVGEHGVEGLSVRRVASRAGVSLGSVYQYYATSEALVADWELREHEKLAQLVVQAATEAALASLGLEAAIRKVVLVGFDGVTDHFRNYKTSHMPMSNLQRRLAVLLPAAQALSSALSAGPWAKRLRPRDLVMTLRVALMASAYGALSSSKSDMPDADRSAWRDAMADMVVAALVLDRPARTAAPSAT